MTANSHPSRQNIIIVGCGRLGAELALALTRPHYSVTIIDSNQRAFDRLGPDFVGRTVQGEAVDQDVLLRAGIEEAHAFAAVTSLDSVNIVTARVARELYNVEHVVARIYNPTKALIYEKFGIQSVAATSWGAQRFEQLIVHSGLRSVGTVGNGDLQLYEIIIPKAWAARPLNELVPVDQAAVGALTRGGKSVLAAHDLTLQEDDILQVTATGQGATLLRQRLKTNGD